MLSKLSGIRAVLFDVYGTLIISGDGGTAPDPARALRDAVKATTNVADIDAERGVQCLRDAIDCRHRELRGQGIDYPEVEMTDIWCRTVADLVEGGCLPGDARHLDAKRLAVEYEVRVNPAWPMPGLRETLRTLDGGGIAIGLVSNAQFYTPLLFPALLEASAEELGVDASLQYYSYQFGHAKPGLRLYAEAGRELARRGIQPDGVLYVGNDMLNDMVPATRMGFHPALFAGDARSLRLRTGDPRVDPARPELIIDDLASLIECLG